MSDVRLVRLADADEYTGAVARAGRRMCRAMVLFGRVSVMRQNGFTLIEC